MMSEIEMRLQCVTLATQIRKNGISTAKQITQDAEVILNFVTDNENIAIESQSNLMKQIMELAQGFTEGLKECQNTEEVLSPEELKQAFGIIAAEEKPNLKKSKKTNE